MFLKSQILPDLIGFILICLQSFKTCFTLNMIEFQEIDYLASNLTPNECFQLYDMFQHHHMRKDEILNYIQKRSHTIPCITLLSTWLTDPGELNYPTFDNVTSKLTKIGREDLAFQLNRSLIHRRNKTNISGAKDLEDERRQRSTCPSETSEKMKIFWGIFIGVLTILILLLLCICCYFCICEKLRCTCSRTGLNYCGNQEEKEEEYCLCGDNFKTTSFEDYYTNKKESSHFKKVLSNFQQYFKNRKEKKKEKLRYVRFQKLKRKLQKMYFEQRKEIRVNRQEEKILNSLTEEERNELGEIICEMRFFLDSDKETEKLLLSGKRSATFIIDMKNLHQPKITRSHVSNQEIKTIKKWESRDRFSTSLSEDMATYISQTKTSSESEILRSNREKKSHKNSNSHKKKVSRQYLGNKREKQISKELEVKSEFLKCYPMSESDKNYSSPVTRQENQRFFHESDWKSNFSTSEESELSTFRSENQLEKFQNPTQIANKIQSDIENQKKNSINVIKSKSMIDLNSMKVNDISKLSSQQEKTKTTNDKQNRGDYLNNNQNKPCNLTKKINKNSSRSIRNFNSCWSFTARYNKRNLEKSNENIDPIKNSDRGDTESQLDLCEIYDELGFLFSQHMKQQSYPCYRKYCLLRRHLKQKTHDLKQCQVKKNYFQYYPKGQAPSCSSGNVCRDTYDEYNLMRASPRERKKIRQLVYERRKKFLDQPCISPGRQVLQVLSV